jgi:hypothetical protein
MKTIFLLVMASILSLSLMAQRYSGKNSVTPEEKLNNQYCSGLFKTYDGTIIDMLNEDNISANGYTNILEWLQGRVAGLQIYYTRYGTAIPFIRSTRASIFVDEMPVDPGFVRMLPVSDIAMIKIIKGPFVGAVGNGGGGTIAIYTLKGDDEEGGEHVDEGK